MDRFDMALWPEFVKIKHRFGDFCTIIDQVVIDSRRIDSKNALFFALQGQTDGHEFVLDAFHAGAKFAVVRSDWQIKAFVPEHFLLRVESPLKALQSLACCYRKSLKVPTIAICGSYGKTMCKDLLYSILKNSDFHLAASPESFNSQIGVALSIFEIKKTHKMALIEAAISEIGEMQNLVDMIGPEAAILTHLGKKHLATLKDTKITAQEFFKLLSAVGDNSWVLLPENKDFEPYYSQLKANYYCWNKENKSLPHVVQNNLKEKTAPYTIYFPDGSIYAGEATSEFSYFQDLLNITIKAAWLCGACKEAIIETLKVYVPEPMRTEIWKAPMGATFISDSYCSDPQSIDQTLKFYSQVGCLSKKIFLFGGMRETKSSSQTPYRRIAKAIRAACVDLLVLYGENHYEAFADELKKMDSCTKVICSSSVEEALKVVEENICSNDCVISKGSTKIPIEKFMELFNDGICNNISTINFEAIRANIALIKQKLPKETKIMAAVKAFAYGTGDLATAKFLARCGIDLLCLSTPDEAIALRRCGVRQSLFVINAAHYEAYKLVKWQLEVAVSDKIQIQTFATEAKRQGKCLKVHLHVDTGMNRFGCRKEDALDLAKEIQGHDFLILEGIMTHFACAEDSKDDAYTLYQSKEFDTVIKSLKNEGIDPPWKHAANSSGAIRFYMPQYNMVRIGLALYGLYASQSAKQALELRQAVSLTSRIVGINICHEGQTVSYGRSYKVKRPIERIAILPVGYFDGLHRNYSGKGEVIIRGKRAKMVGKICMDFMMVDITDIADAVVGDSALIFGEDAYGNYLCPQELADRGDSIVHQLITCLGPRIQRVFIHEESK